MPQFSDGFQTARTAPSTVDEVADATRADTFGALHADIVELVNRLAKVRAGSDALVAACVACLDAARSIAGALALDLDEEYRHLDESRQDALHAARAATMAIRFALVEDGDIRRRMAHRDKDGG